MATPEKFRGERERLAEIAAERLSEVSKHHPDRNEDAVLGDTERRRALLDAEGNETGSVLEADFFEQLSDATTPPETESKKKTAEELLASFGKRTEVAALAKQFSSELYEATQHEAASADRLKSLEVYGVFDGISGGQKDEKGNRIENGAGWVASRIISAEISRTLADELKDGSSADETEAALRKAVTQADARVKKLRGGTKELKEMAAAGDVVRLVRNPDGGAEVVAAHFGDSRIYKVDKEGKLERVTFDDNVAKALNEFKILSREEFLDVDKVVSDAENIDDPALDKQLSRPIAIPGFGNFKNYRDFYKRRNEIGKAIGGDTFKIGEDKQIGNIIRFKLEPGEKLLLTSDGVHDNVRDRDIEKVIAAGGGSKEVVAAARTAIENGGKVDDVTALVIEAKGERQEYTPEKAIIITPEERISSLQAALETIDAEKDPVSYISFSQNVEDALETAIASIEQEIENEENKANVSLEARRAREQKIKELEDKKFAREAELYKVRFDREPVEKKIEELLNEEQDTQKIQLKKENLLEVYTESSPASLAARQAERAETESLRTSDLVESGQASAPKEKPPAPPKGFWKKAASLFGLGGKTKPPSRPSA